MKISCDELLKLYIKNKLSIYEISKKVKIKPVTLYWYMNKYSISRRSSIEAGKISWEKGVSRVTDKMRKASMVNVKKAPLGRTTDSNRKQSETMMKKYDNGMKPWNFREGAQSDTNRRVRTKRWIRLSKKIKERDNWTCQECGKTNIILQVHHIDKDGYNNNYKNLITLCISCHKKLH